MQRAMRRPASRFVAEHAGRPRVDLHRVEIGDPAPGQRGDVVGMLLRREDRAHRLGHEQRGPHAVDRHATRSISPRVTETTISMSCRSGPGTTTTRTEPLDGVAGLPLRELVLVRARAARRARTARPRGRGRRRARSRPRVRSRRRSACRADASVTHDLPPVVSACRRRARPRRSGPRAARRLARSPRSSSAPSSRSPPGSGIWLLWDSSASILRSTASVMSM